MDTAADRDRKWFLPDGDRSFGYFRLPGIRCGSDSAFNPSIVRRLTDKRYDIIVVCGYSSPTRVLAILYMKIKGIPFILNADGGFAAKSEVWLKSRLKRLLIGSARYWLTSGIGGREYFRFYGADPEHTYIYPFTSVEQRDILPEPLGSEKKEQYKQMLGINDLLVLSVGQFIPRKGYDVLLKAWSLVKNKNANLVIIGGGPGKDSYLQMVNELELENVRIIGFTKKEELLQWYRAADLFVFPTRYDIWGLVVNEAMAQGLPVISTDGALAGLELICDGVNGYIVPAEDAGALASRMETVLSDDMLRRDMAIESIDVISSYTIENMARIHMEIFEAILHKQ
jgi:glycosyltransferase involved in cell wall biosynthesis